MTEIRNCTLADLPYLYDICWMTGLDGQSAEGAVSDKYKIGQYFVAPYVHFEPDCCFTATVNGIPKGYVVGTSDTESYTRWLNTEWLPRVRRLYDFSGEPPLDPYGQFIDECLKNDTIPDPDLTDFRAHLHIDLLSDLQGRGMGRKLMEKFFQSCREKDSGKVHLAVGRTNEGAIAFYRKIGMYEIKADEGALFLGYDL